MTALQEICRIDYTVIFARDLEAMRRFYGSVLGFEEVKSLGDSWFEYRIGQNTLALTKHGVVFDDPVPPDGALSLQLAFRVALDTVDRCAHALELKGVRLLAPVKDQIWGHRTAFFRDPDGNVLEIFADTDEPNN